MLSKKSKVSKEQAILDAASELFLQRGFKSVSIGEIMQKVACSRETIYRYFSGKEDIFANIISRRMDAYLDTMKAVITTVGAEDLRDGLLDWSFALFKTVDADRLARHFVGMLLYHVMHTRVLGVRKKLSQAQMKKLVTEVVDDFLLGYAQPG